jgi:hypothetical protein
MPELGEDLAAGRMNGIGDALPAGQLLRGVNSRRTDVADALRADLRPFGNDQPGRGALCIIG